MSQIVEMVEMVSTDPAVSAVGEAVNAEPTEAPTAVQGDLLRETAYAVRQRLYQLLTCSRPRTGAAAADGSALAEPEPQRV